MFRRELITLGSLTTFIFLAVVLGGVWLASVIRSDSARIASDSLPGLIQSGSAMALTKENWLRVQVLLDVGSTEEQAGLIHQIHTNSNEGLWLEYAHTIWDAEDTTNYEKLLIVRTNFVASREQFFALVQHNQVEAARAFFEKTLRPSYNGYLLMSHQVFEYNARVGKHQAADLRWISRFIPLALGLAASLVFALGVLVGLRGALTGLITTPTSHKLCSEEPSVLRK